MWDAASSQGTSLRVTSYLCEVARLSEGNSVVRENITQERRWLRWRRLR